MQILSGVNKSLTLGDVQVSDQSPQRPPDQREELVFQKVIRPPLELQGDALPSGPVYLVEVEQLLGLHVRPLLATQVGVQLVVPSRVSNRLFNPKIWFPTKH
jgi:hypothetical protein